jgi:hypothetical protein
MIARAFKNALLPDPGWGPAHGLPTFIGHDNGTEFLAHAITLILMDVGMPNRISDGYSPHQNGPIESYHRLEEQMHCVPQPFYAHGPAQRGDIAILPDLDRVPHYATWEQEYAAEGGFVWRYNHEYREHAELDGRTPVEAWEAAPPPPPVDRASVGWLGRDPYRVQVRNDGIQVLNAIYQHPDFDGRTGTYVIACVDERKHDAEIFTEDGEWLCTAINQRDQTDDQRIAVVARRTASRRGRRTEVRDTLADTEGRLPVTAGTTPPAARDDIDALVERVRRRGASGFNQPVEG